MTGVLLQYGLELAAHQSGSAGAARGTCLALRLAVEGQPQLTLKS
jgi:hypothetical protein